MKIDLIIGSLQSGGAERVVSTIANYLVANGHNVRLITFRSGEKYKLDQRIVRVKLHREFKILNYALFRAIIYMFRFYFFKSNRPDIISFHIGMMGLSTIPIAKFYNIPIVGSEHINHTSTLINSQKRFLWNRLYPKLDGLTVLTNYDIPFFKNKTHNTIVMHNPSSFSPLEAQELDRSKVVLSIGSLNRYDHKGFDNLIDIANKVISEEPDWQFLIVGEGEDGKRFLQEKINHLGLENNIKLLGYRSDIDKLLRKSSIFMLCSRYEGLPMALIEATSQGIACISYDCISGPSEIIEHEKNGILVNDQNQEEMVDQLLRLMRDKELRIHLGTNAIKSSDKFAIEKIGSNWVSFFNDILRAKNHKEKT